MIPSQTQALLDYTNGEVWVQQLSAFVDQVASPASLTAIDNAEGSGSDAHGPQVVLVGNSLGGFASLATAAEHPEQIRWGLSLRVGLSPLARVNSMMSESIFTPTHSFMTACKPR